MRLSVVTRLNPADPRHGGHVFMTPDNERAFKEKHLGLVQSFAKREVAPDDFHIRGMLLCNSARDYYYSRFTVGALDEIVEMLPGSPVMSAHDYGTNPEGTFMSAQRVTREVPGVPKRDSQWVEALYFVPADSRGNEIVRRIDLGVQREVSIGWRCAGADCSECGDPIWACPHIPGDIYKKGICEYHFSGVTSVLEGSFVFRGGQKDTSTFVPEGAAGEGAPEAQAAMRSAMIHGSRDLAWDLIQEAKQLNNMDQFILRHHKRGKAWATGALMDRAVGMGALFGQQGDRANTQSILCGKERFSTRQSAARWARDHDFRADKVKQVDRGFQFEQFPERLVEPDSFKAVRLDEGVEANTCKKKRADAGEDRGRSLEEMFS